LDKKLEKHFNTYYIRYQLYKHLGPIGTLGCFICMCAIPQVTCVRITSYLYTYHYSYICSNIYIDIQTYIYIYIYTPTYTYTYIDKKYTHKKIQNKIIHYIIHIYIYIYIYIYLHLHLYLYHISTSTSTSLYLLQRERFI
jgi:hypothetical protein